MRVITAMLILLLAGLHCVPSYAGGLSLALSEKLESTGANSMVSVIVRMSVQTSLKATTRGISGRNKLVRLKKVIQSLKKTALEKQGTIIEIIKKTSLRTGGRLYPILDF